MAPSNIHQNKKKQQQQQLLETEELESKKKTIRLYLYGLAALFVLVGVGAQLYITLTTFHDPRTDLLHKHLDAFNISSKPSSLPESVRASQTLGLVPGQEFGSTKNQDGAVLGVVQKFKKNDVVMSIPFDALVDPTLPNTFAQLLSQNADWQNPKRKYPRNIMSLATWVLVEMKKSQLQKKKGTANDVKPSLFENWIEATGANQVLIHSEIGGNKLNSAHAAAHGGESAYYWDMKKSKRCVSDIFSVDFNETISLVPKLQEGLGFICVDDDVAEKFPEAQRILCRVFDEETDDESTRGQYGPDGIRLLVSEDEIRVALDLVNRRCVMNQALVPVFDFSEVSLRQNVGLRVDSINKHLVVFALYDLPVNTPLRFQRFLGKWDAYMRTGHSLPTLGLEAINGKLMDGGSKQNNELMQKFCHERQGHLIFHDDGSMHPALRECFGLMSILGAELEDAERGHLTKEMKKYMNGVKKRYVEDAKKELEANPDLRKWAAGNLTENIKKKLKMLAVDGQAMLESQPYCERFEGMRQQAMRIYERAIEKLKAGIF